MKLTIFIFSMIVCNVCFAGKYVYPTKFGEQEEFFVQGGSVISSKKLNEVMMYPTKEKISNEKCSFYFIISNSTAQPINFRVNDLSVTDQCGRPFRIVRKEEHLDRKRSEKNWALVASAICAGLDSYNAQQAGNINYQSSTYSSGNANFNSYNSNGTWSRGSIYGQGSSYTNGTIQVEALRQQAQRQANLDAQVRTTAIQSTYEDFEYGYQNFYFDSNTIFPGGIYEANFQIEVPNTLEKDLQYLFFTYNVGGEEHTFCFYCWNKK